jgi:hypothetical protein
MSKNEIILQGKLSYQVKNTKILISSNYVFKGIAFETLGPWCKEAIDFINAIGNRLIAESGDSKSKKFFSKGFPLRFNVETLQAFGVLFQIPHYYRKFLYC